MSGPSRAVIPQTAIHIDRDSWESWEMFAKRCEKVTAPNLIISEVRQLSFCYLLLYSSAGAVASRTAIRGTATDKECLIID